MVTTNGSNHFDWTLLYNYTYYDNASSPYILHPFADTAVRALSLEGCIAKVGTGLSYYEQRDVYERVILWRLPLIALWATTTIPAFKFHTWIFTLVHLIADPIDTVWSLLYKLDLAQRTAQWARRNDISHSLFTFKAEFAGDDAAARIVAARTPGETLGHTIQERQRLINDALNEDLSPLPEYFYDIIASIITAYDEWDHGDEAIRAMNYAFNPRWPAVQRTAFRRRCAQAAFYIAADRVSRFLPTVVAGIVFCVQIFAGFWKTLSALDASYDASNPVSIGLNRAPHNIAFGVLFFWLPLLVLLTALVGSSQTSHMVPRILDEFRRDYMLSYDQFDRQGRRPTTIDGFTGTVHQRNRYRVAGRSEDRHFPDILPEKDERWTYGGLPVWQGGKFRDFRRAAEIAQDDPSHRSFATVALLLSFVIVIVPTAGAISLSWLTPSIGFDCRTMSQLSFFIMWTMNALSDWILFTWAESQHSGGLRKISHLTLYWITFTKDFVLAAASITFLTWSALGIFNRCNCWCKWSFGHRYLSFTQDQYIFDLIKDRLAGLFPFIVFTALLFQIVAFIGIRIYFHEGCQVLRQRDIDSVLKSRNSWWSRLRKRFKSRKSLRRTPTIQLIDNPTFRTVTYQKIPTTIQEGPIAQPAMTAIPAHDGNRAVTRDEGSITPREDGSIGTQQESHPLMRRGRAL